MSFFDWLTFLREILRGGPIDVVTETLLWDPSQTTCAWLYIWDMWCDVGSFIVGICLSLFIYMTVVKKEDLSYTTNKRFWWNFVMIFLAYSTAYIVVIGVVAHRGGFHLIGSGCGPKWFATSIIGLIQSIICVIIEIGSFTW